VSNIFAAAFPADVVICFGLQPMLAIAIKANKRAVKVNLLVLKKAASGIIKYLKD
jgi:hypothetical protein